MFVKYTVVASSYDIIFWGCHTSILYASLQHKQSVTVFYNRCSALPSGLELSEARGF